MPSPQILAGPDLAIVSSRVLRVLSLASLPAVVVALGRCFRVQLVTTRTAVSALAVVILAVACAPHPGTTVESGSGPVVPIREGPASAKNRSAKTADELTAALRAALQQEGMAFHTVIEQEFAWPDAGSQRKWGLEAWLDPAAGVAREHFQLDPAAALELSDDLTVVANAGDTYYRDRTSPTVEAQPADCPGMTPVLFEYLRPLCADGLEGFTLEVKTVEHEGAPAFALVYSVSDESELPASGFGYVVGTTNRLVLDASTSLPLVLITEATFVDGVPQLVRAATFTNDFVPLESLATGFFDPLELGYVAPDPAGTVEAAQAVRPVVWLGRQLEVSGGSLPLSRISLERPGTGPGRRTHIEYEPVVSSEMLGGVSLGVWTSADWAAALGTPEAGMWWNSPCVRRSEVELGDGRAVLFAGREVPFDPSPFSSAPSAPPAPPSVTGAAHLDAPARGEAACDETAEELYMAHVFLGDVVVTINAADCLTCSPAPLPTEYRSLPGLQALAKRLVRVR